MATSCLSAIRKRNMSIQIHRFLCFLTLSATLLTCGCSGSKSSSPTKNPRSERILNAIEKRWKSPYDSLPTKQLSIISPHNQNIQNEFARAFSLNYALNHGKRVKIQWRDVGGGGNKILSYLLNVYSNSQTSGVDIVWGGGSDVFEKLTKAGFLEKFQLPDPITANIPHQVSGIKLRDQQGYWCGSTISGFGILANKPLLKMIKRPLPQTWDDLDQWRYHGLLALADPTKSSSAASAYKHIVQSAPSWSAGWQKLLGILSNAKKFYDGAGAAADAVISQAPITTCISFYGTMRVSRYPKRLEYITPKGQAVLSPDPIGILKNPPDKKLAMAFVRFVLSQQGQALLALKAGTDDGPEYKPLHMFPVRRDFYRNSRLMSQTIDGIADPYEALPENEMAENMKLVNYDVLKRLIYSAAVVNASEMIAARKVIEKSGDQSLKNKFYALPDNIATIQAMQQTAEQLKDPLQAEIIETDWQQFFRGKYESILEGE